MDKIKPIENTKHLCWKCLQEHDNIHKFVFGDLGYGSSFDCFGSQIQLCDKCFKESNSKIWNFKEVDNEKEYGGHYRYEDEIWEYIRNLPIQSQELFHNECGFGCDSGYTMEAQDWIDYHLDILPHEKCKEYGLYSPQERQAYKDRFPTCNKVYKEVYKDGSAGCWCINRANGNADGTCGLNISDKCYMCKDYIPRKDAMKVINRFDEYIKNETLRLNDMLIYAQERLMLITDNPKEYFEQYN